MTPPAPFTPEDCDLRGMEWMPLFGARLFMSDFEARANDAEFRAAVRLWWMAWQQVPAASLPDDDAVLCRLAGLGRDIKTWKKIKEAVLHGFTLCSDGRFYHKLLSVQAKDAWDRRTKEREKKQKWREGRSVTENEWYKLRAEVFARDGFRCVHCGSTETLECDHVIPVSKGGKSTLDNLQALCRKCNAGKCDKPDKHRSKEPEDQVPRTGTNGSENGSWNGSRTGHEPEKPVPGMGDRTGQDRTGQEKEKRERGAGVRPPPARREKIPEDWLPSPDAVAVAKEAGVTDLVETVEQFVDYYTANGKPLADWEAAFRVWCRREPELRRNGK